MGVPLLTILAISWGRWSDLTSYDWYVGYLLFGPFTLAGAFLVAGPSYALQRKGRPELVKAGTGLLVCGAVGIAMLVPFSERIPWEGAGFGAATFLIWLAIYRIGRLSWGDPDEVRSMPSG